MCDYSLMVLSNRLACEGEELLVHRFPSGTKGLAARSDLERGVIPFPRHRNRFGSLIGEIGSVLREIVAGPEASKTVPAVCIPPGARLLLRDIPQRVQRKIHVGHIEEVTFTQISADYLIHRDAVRFRNGCGLSLQRLQEGQRVRVLDLSLADTIEELELLAPAG